MPILYDCGEEQIDSAVHCEKSVALFQRKELSLIT